MKDGIAVKRNSNFEFLRIVAMAMIVIWHLCVHGIENYIEITDWNQINQFLYFAIKSVSVLSVNLYVLISGYFSYKRTKIKPQKVFKLVFQTFFFSLAIYLALIILGITDFSIKSSILSFFPIFFNRYWFITIYLIMFVLSPYLNIVIKNISKRNHLKLMTTLFFINCVWQFIYEIDHVGANYGYSVFHFLFLYFVAAFLGKYGNLIKDFDKHVYLTAFLGLTLINTIGSYITSGEINRFFWYNSPVIVLSSFCLFMFFKKINFQSETVNNVSKYTLGVYLIHEHFLVRPLLWKDMGIVERVVNGSELLLVARIIIVGILIFSVCLILSYFTTNIVDLNFNYISEILNGQKVKRKIKKH